MLTYNDAKALVKDKLVDWYYEQNPDWLWDPFPFNTGNTDTEALRQAQVAMADRVIQSTPSSGSTVATPLAVVLEGINKYDVTVYESSSSTPIANSILSSTKSSLVLSSQENSAYATKISLLKKGNSMSALAWDQTGTRYYELGVDHGVLYIPNDAGEYDTGVAWNGLTSVTESPDGAEANDLWADNMKYGSIRSAETFGGTIEAYTYPVEFAACDGSKEIVAGAYLGQQPRQSFGFSYRTKIGNDTPTTTDDGYKLHLVYGATASPSEKQYETVNDSPEAITFSWEFDTTPVPVTGAEATSIITIDSTKVDKTKLAALEKVLYGSSDAEPRLPLPDEVGTLLGAA